MFVTQDNYSNVYLLPTGNFGWIYSGEAGAVDMNIWLRYVMLLFCLTLRLTSVFILSCDFFLCDCFTSVVGGVNNLDNSCLIGDLPGHTQCFGLMLMIVVSILVHKE